MKACLLNLCCALALFLLFTGQIRSQSTFHVYPQAGLLIGTPIGIIPEGATGQPGIHFYPGVELRWTSLRKLSLNVGAFLAQKASEFQTPVAGKYDIAEGVLGIRLPFPINVNYRGTVYGTVDNQYLDFPLYVDYPLGRRVLLTLGYQYSRLLAGRFNGHADITALTLNFPHEEWDETHMLRQDDHAVLSGLHYRLLDRLELRMRFTYALNSLFTEVPEDMEDLNNFYMGVMVAYGFGIKFK